MIVNYGSFLPVINGSIREAWQIITANDGSLFPVHGSLFPKYGSLLPAN